jgi:hypothetical protein
MTAQNIVDINTASLNRKVQTAANRILARKRLRVWFKSILVGSIFCLTLLVASRFVYIPHVFSVTGAALGISAIAGLVFALRSKASSFEGAVELDSLLDLKERLATATELQEKGGISEPLIFSQLADSVRIGESVSPAVVRIGLPKEAPLTILFLILCASVTLFAPIYASTGAEAKEMQTGEIIRLQLARRGLREGSDLKKAFDETAKNIEKGKMKEARFSLATVKENLYLEHSKAAERERALAELESHPQLTKLVRALREDSPDALSTESQKLSSEDAGAADIAQMLKDVAKEISEDSAFRTLLEQTVKAIESRRQKELEESLKSLAAAVKETGSAEAISEALALLEVTEEKLTEASGGSVIGGVPRRKPRPTPSPTLQPSTEETSVSLSSEQIEQAIAKQNVPERFKQIVRGYFIRGERE